MLFGNIGSGFCGRCQIQIGVSSCEQSKACSKRMLGIVSNTIVLVAIVSNSTTVHGWDYRRYIVAALKRAPEPPAYSTRKRPKPTTASELSYTTSKISASFSNYSAWHYRSKLLPILWQEKGYQAGSSEIQASIDEGA